MSKDTTPYEVLIDERVEKDLEKVPKHVVEKFLKQLDEGGAFGALTCQATTNVY